MMDVLDRALANALAQAPAAPRTLDHRLLSQRQWKADKAAAELQLLADDPTYRPGPVGTRRERLLIRKLEYYAAARNIRPTIDGVDRWAAKLDRRIAEQREALMRRQAFLNPITISAGNQ